MRILETLIIVPCKNAEKVVESRSVTTPDTQWYEYIRGLFAFKPGP